MAAIKQRQWTAEEYLAFERASREKHELLDGNVYLMTAASRNHDLISGNAFASLHAQLRRRTCEVYKSDIRVRIDARHYFYPDVAVACDKPEFEDSEVDTLLNPTLVIEVLSPLTEQYDRGKKFQGYRTLNSLQEYVLISQEEAHMERYLRQANGGWLLSEVNGLEASLELPSINCTLSLADVYDRVVFEDEQS